MRYKILILVGVVVIGSIIGAYVYLKPDQTSFTSNDRPVRPTGIPRESSSTSITRNDLDTIAASLHEAFPKAHLSIALKQRNDSGTFDTLIYSSDLPEGEEYPVYYASAVKPIFATLAAERATQLNIDLDENVIPIEITSNLTREMYTDFVEDNDHPGSEETGYPYVSRMIMPHINGGQLQQFAAVLRSRTKLAPHTSDIVSSYNAIDDGATKNAATALLIGYAQVRGDSDILADMSIDRDEFLSEIQGRPLGKASVKDVIQSAVGPSSNYAVSRMVAFINLNLPTGFDSAQDYMQSRIDTVLGPQSQFTFNNSTKEKEKTGLWNAGYTSELLEVAHHMFENDGTFTLSTEYQEFLTQTMRVEYSDPFILMRSYFPEEPSLEDYPWSKSGYFFDLHVEDGRINSMPNLMQQNNWDTSDGEFATYILTLDRYKDFDYAIAIGIPHSYSDASDLSVQKKQATEIVFGQFASLIQ